MSVIFYSCFIIINTQMKEYSETSHVALIYHITLKN